MKYPSVGFEGNVIHQFGVSALVEIMEIYSFIAKECINKLEDNSMFLSSMEI
jgi:hypothetical protein